MAASIILVTADGLGTNAIQCGTGRSKSVVWRWQERFIQECMDGLLRDKTRPSGRKPRDRRCRSRI
jgi:transposase